VKQIRHIGQPCCQLLFLRFRANSLI
jgi:hypothetical protein